MIARAATEVALSSFSPARVNSACLPRSGVSARPASTSPTLSCLPRNVLLASRLAAVCTGWNRGLVRAEAASLVAWATCFVDWKIVDEAIGWAERAERRPVLPRALAKGLAERAQVLGVYPDPFVPVCGAPAAL